jgi:hypothetical protein
MKNIYLALLFISTSLFAQQYETDWNKVIKNENVGKIKTANKIVDKIYKKAVVKRELIYRLQKNCTSRETLPKIPNYKKQPLRMY